MKPPSFEYLSPGTVEEALSLLAEAPESTTLLAGGQSLVPLLNMRLARPERIVDLNRVSGLDQIEEVEDRLVCGAMVRQRTIERSTLVRERVPLLTEAVKHVAHVAIRTRGTLGGSLAHADPAAELPTVMTALDARVWLCDVSGRQRFVPADRFFLGPFTTTIQPGELLCRVEIPLPPPSTGWAFAEVARTHGAFALVGAVALIRLDQRRRIEHLRLSLCGVGGKPYDPPWLADRFLEEPANDATFDAIASRVVAEIEPTDDIHATAAYRRTVAGYLAGRVLRLAADRAA